MSIETRNAQFLLDKASVLGIAGLPSLPTLPLLPLPPPPFVLPIGGKLSPLSNLTNLKSLSEDIALSGLKSLGIPTSTAGATASIRSWQTSHGIPATGLLEGKTLPTLTLTKVLDSALGTIDRTTFVETDRSLRGRSQYNYATPRFIVLHETQGRTARQGHLALVKGGHSTHYIIDEDGVVYQCVEPIHYNAEHANKDESRPKENLNWSTGSIGIDVANLLYPELLGSEDGDDERRTRVSTSKKGWFNSQSRQVIRYTTAQRLKLPILINALCVHFGIPYTWDTNFRQSTNGKPIRSFPDIKTFQGVVAHGQVSSVRTDGFLALETLMGVDA